MEEDKFLQWEDVVRRDPKNPKVIESQESEKEYVLAYVAYCEQTQTNVKSFNNYQAYQSKQKQ